MSKKKPSINYLFYLTLFIAVYFLTAFETSPYAIIYAFFQTLFFFSSLILIEKTTPRQFLHFYIFLLSFGFLLLFVNFILLQIIDNSLIFIFRYFKEVGLFISLRAANVNYFFLWLFLLIIIAVPILGLFIYKFCKRFSLIYPLKINYPLLLSVLLLSFGMSYWMRQNDPVGTQLCSQRLFFYKKAAGFEPYPFSSSLPEITDALYKKVALKQKPNIFIFVSESMRPDFMRENITPNLFNFKNENISFKTAYAAACCSHPSWFSIFHAKYPFLFPNAKKGAPALEILKKLGYKINLFSSAELAYFDMDQIIFGKDHCLIDEYNEYSKHSLNAAKRDALAISALKELIEKKKLHENNLFIIFLDSTHAEYSWQMPFLPTHLPYASSIPYLSLSFTKKDLFKIKNRYLNALGYIDYLFGDFILFLKENDLFSPSMIIFTGDHGEEFFEEGALSHNSHLNDYQLKVPLYMKLNSSMQKQKEIVSHLDIFPTILHLLLDSAIMNEYFHGKSIFSPSPSNIISLKQEFGSYPFEIVWHLSNNQKEFGRVSKDLVIEKRE